MIQVIFGSFLLFIDIFYIYIYCRKCNAEFKKLIKMVGHHAHFFSKNDVEHTHNFDFI